MTLKDPPASLRPGLNATADITTARKKNVLAVPIQAVVVRAGRQGRQGRRPRRRRGRRQTAPRTPRRRRGARPRRRKASSWSASGEAPFRPVKTGIMGETDIEIIDGLKEGDEIVTGSYKTLRTLKDKAQRQARDRRRSKSS